jgi:hypothetical protein
LQANDALLVLVLLLHARDHLLLRPKSQRQPLFQTARLFLPCSFPLSSCSSTPRPFPSGQKSTSELVSFGFLSDHFCAFDGTFLQHKQTLIIFLVRNGKKV